MEAVFATIPTWTENIPPRNLGGSQLNSYIDFSTDEGGFF
jgi:hypothetical protein